MSFEEKSTWINLAIQLGLGVWYTSQILAKAQATPVTEISYLRDLVTLVVATVVLTVVVHIVVSIVLAGRAAMTGSTAEIDRSDERDKTIGRFAGNIGGVVLGVATIPALGLAVYEFDHFWIAHAILGA
ncbi:MAG: hypothetical protein WD020_06075, partial [Acidimicrobiia bacterium]